ncbi:MucBP domain-containing protein [Fructilactobacillus vespulae]|uniref:DUF5978 domain-containing protein n=1 Tax=Fructilactobacillus vespulae TaxID=1249630 RepID=UPI0039B51A89
MLYNRNQINKITDKKIMKKVKSQWVVVSLATFMLLGGAGFTITTNNVKADTANNQNSSEQATPAKSDSSTSQSNGITDPNPVDVNGSKNDTKETQNETPKTNSSVTTPNTDVQKNDDAKQQSSANNVVTTQPTKKEPEKSNSDQKVEQQDLQSRDLGGNQDNKSNQTNSTYSNDQQPSQSESDKNVKQNDLQNRDSANPDYSSSIYESWNRKPTKFAPNQQTIDATFDKLANDSANIQWQQVDSSYDPDQPTVTRTNNGMQLDINLGKYNEGTTKAWLAPKYFIVRPRDENKSLADLKFTGLDNLENIKVTYPNNKTFNPEHIYMVNKYSTLTQDASQAYSFIIPLKLSGDAKIDDLYLSNNSFKINDLPSSGFSGGIGVDENTNKDINSNNAHYQLNFNFKNGLAVSSSDLTSSYAEERVTPQIFRFHFLDQNTGKEVSPTITKGEGQGYIDQAIIDVPNLTKDGYIFTSTYTQSFYPSKGIIHPSLDYPTLDSYKTNIVYYYSKISTLTINYQDQNGKSISDPTTITGNSGDQYTTTPKEIAGYHVVDTPKEANGNYAYPQDLKIPGNITVNYTYAINTTTLNPVAINNYTKQEIPGTNIPAITITGDHNQGDTVEIPTKDLPNIPDYAKPEGDTVTVTIGENNTVKVPYTQTPLKPVAIDQDTHQQINKEDLPEIKIPGDHKVGDAVDIPTDKLPNVDGYNKPSGNTITVTISENGKVEIPYKQKETPLNPVAIDQDTHQPIDGVKIPEITIKGDHKTGDKVEIPTKDFPSVDGYNQPSGNTITVTIGENGKVEIPYKQKETPLNPVAIDQDTHQPIDGIKIPEITVKGDHKTGDKVEIPTKDFPKVPSYLTPQGDKIIVTIGDNGKVNIPYSKVNNGNDKTTTTTPIVVTPVVKDSNTVIDTPVTITVSGNHQPGDVVKIPTRNIPEVLGYDKPQGEKVTVTIGTNNTVTVPYTPKETTNSNTNAAGNQQKLPQTGETNSSSILGLIGITLLSLFGFLGFSKRQKDEK